MTASASNLKLQTLRVDGNRSGNGSNEFPGTGLGLDSVNGALIDRVEFANLGAMGIALGNACAEVTISNNLFFESRGLIDASGKNPITGNSYLNVSPYGNTEAIVSGKIGTSAATGRSDSTSRFYITGTVQLNQNTLGAVVFVLPSDAHPYHAISFWVYGADKTACQMEAETDGSVILKTATCSLSSLSLSDISFFLNEDPLATGLVPETPVVTNMGPGCGSRACMWLQGKDLCLGSATSTVTFRTSDSSQVLGTSQGTCTGLGTEMAADVPAAAQAQPAVVVTIANSAHWNSYPFNFTSASPSAQ